MTIAIVQASFGSLAEQRLIARLPTPPVFAKAHQLAGGKLSVSGMLTRTKSLLSVRGEKAASQSISALTRIWDNESSGQITHEQAEVALILAEGFMKRNNKGDRGSAKHLLGEVTSRGTDPYARSLASALSGLCEQG